MLIIINFHKEFNFIADTTQDDVYIRIVKSCFKVWLEQSVDKCRLKWEKIMDHKLMGHLTASDATPDEIKELFNDLKYIYDNPFDTYINEAMERGCVYIEQQDPLAN